MTTEAFRIQTINQIRNLGTGGFAALERFFDAQDPTPDADYRFVEGVVDVCGRFERPKQITRLSIEQITGRTIPAGSTLEVRALRAIHLHGRSELPEIFKRVHGISVTEMRGERIKTPPGPFLARLGDLESLEQFKLIEGRRV